ncbi:MAG: DUF4349 domain-containing protein [Leptolyngbya sp. SIO1E4]|nr:DUF4349 domain-containing protein [Leptolyngbya sp. SIO1E4]
MSIDSHHFRQRVPWLMGLLSTAVLVGCSGAPVETIQGADEAARAPSADIISLTEDETQSQSAPTEAGQRRPQLIKNAFLQIELADIDAAVKVISDILKQSQGDLLELSDQENDARAPRQVALELRIPQDNLESVLEQLQALGTVQEQSITAEDVSTQLVDLQARVRNLRKSEETLLGIMERSGSISDVLEVSRELSTVREAIERSDAQLKALQTRVAYSTISLILVSRQQPAPTTSPVGETMSRTWQSATASVRAMSIGLLQLLLWLMAFSPYIAVLVLLGWAGRRWQRQRTS